MFDDIRKTKMIMFITPVVIWLLSGAAAEILGLFWYGIFYRKAAGIETFDLFQALAVVHLKGEILLLTTRAVLSGIVFFILYRRDKIRIQAELYTQRSLKEKPEFFSEPPVGIKILPLIILCGIGFSLAVNLIFQLSGLNSNHSILTIEASIGLPEFQLILLILLDTLIAPVSEELMNRGLIYKRMRTYQTVLMSEICACLVFALMHGDIISGIYAFIFGLLLTEIFENTRGLHYSIICHAAANITAVLLALVPDLTKAVSRNRILYLIIGIVLFLIGRLGIAFITEKGRNHL